MITNNTKQHLLQNSQKNHIKQNPHNQQQQQDKEEKEKTFKGKILSSIHNEDQKTEIQENSLKLGAIKKRRKKEKKRRQQMISITIQVTVTRETKCDLSFNER